MSLFCRTGGVGGKCLGVSWWVTPFVTPPYIFENNALAEFSNIENKGLGGSRTALSWGGCLNGLKTSLRAYKGPSWACFEARLMARTD
jgi:hypothetical protein